MDDKSKIITGIISLLVFFILLLLTLSLLIKKYSLLPNIILSFSLTILLVSTAMLIYLKKWSTLFSSIVFALIIGLVLSFFLPLIFVPKTEIEVSCNKNHDGSLTFVFNNIADFAGEDFNIDILRGDIKQQVSFRPWVGKLCESYFIISDPKTQQSMGVRIECKYIPPRTELPFDIYSDSTNNSYEIQYYSKTTEYARESVSCN